MHPIYYVGLDIHKRTIAFCVKCIDGTLYREGTIAANRLSLKSWINELPGPWICAMEATMFTGWIYDYLKDYAVDIKVAHPEMLKAITAAKKKNDRADAERLADLLRVDLIPECYMVPTKFRDLRRVLRFRTLIVGTAVKLKNRMSGLLMEVGAEYDKRRLHGRRYFNNLLDSVEDVPESVIELLKLSRGGLELFTGIQRQLVSALRTNALIRERVALLMTIPGVGEVTALTWVLEMAEIDRFPSFRKAVSYCGLCSAQHESAGKERRGPLSKKRNRHIQTVLIEAAKLAPRWNPDLAVVYDRERLRGNHNQATIAVARKLVIYMLAVERRGTPFEMKTAESEAA